VASSVDQANREFWNELCGTQLANTLGITDDSTESLRRFDDWFFEFYPYLNEEIPFNELAGKRVLEVGLGYGSVTGRLLKADVDVTALDIAQGPIGMAAHRAKLLGRTCEAIQASILEPPFPDEHFDAVIGIGSYHHTGDTPRALAETFRMLRPGGTAYIMVYNAYSYRRWLREFGPTSDYFKADKFGVGDFDSGSQSARAQYDVDSEGQAAPHTDFFSVGAMRRICKRWSAVEYRRRNIGAEGLLQRIPRPLALALFGSAFGLDIYFKIRK
jgi:SAM-dependent methyltransferase